MSLPPVLPLPVGKAASELSDRYRTDLGLQANARSIENRYRPKEPHHSSGPILDPSLKPPHRVAHRFADRSAVPDAVPQNMRPDRSFQGLILTLQHYWAEQGCVILQPYDMEMGAGTFHPATTLRSLGPQPWRAAYVQPSRRPKDGRYGENPNRLQHYYQYQVIMKPSPPNLQDLYLNSLRAIGLDMSLHDVRFVEDDWESPTLGAWGLGWECWCDGMEVSQFTYFQQVAGFECAPVSGELTYGLERLAMYVQGVDNVYDLNFNGGEGNDKVTYGDIFRQAEQEYSRHNFEYADTDMLFELFRDGRGRLPQIPRRRLARRGQRAPPPDGAACL